MKGNNMEYGLQLFSVRDFAEKDLIGTLEKVAELEYNSVEFAGFFGHPANEIHEALRLYGLSVAGIHSGLDELENDFRGTVNFVKGLGCERYVLPGAPIWTNELLSATIVKLKEYQKRLANEGISLVYHNHTGEFTKNSDGTIPYDELIENTDIEFELDTCWSTAAGTDTIGLMRKLSERIKYIHLRDVKTVDGKYIGKALGEGNIPVLAIRDEAIRLGIGMIVESGGLNPDGVSEVARCMKYLKENEA